ncbi:MAG: transposase [Bacteroidetes bacterium]|nr:transposase [Bacteroidota bacterium]
MYSSNRAAKDKRDRARAIEKAEKIIQQKNYSLLKEQRGYKKYIKTKESENVGDRQFHIDYDRIERESLFDDYSGLECSREDLSPEEIIEQYHNLYKVEESFRIIKSTMQTRPIFLRTKSHIEGHFVMCFLAFLLERELEFRLRKNKIEFSPEKIKEALNGMELSEIKIENETYYLRGKHNSLASKIFSTLRLRQPENILVETDALNYVKQ